MRTLWIILAIFIFAMSAGCAKQPKIEIAHPYEPAEGECARLATFGDGPANEASVPGWKLASPANVYDKKTLFDYINGAAELYFAYDFRAAAAAEYRNGKTSIIVDVYDMTSPESAFGIYSLNRYPEANYVDIGNEGILAYTNLDFWKGRYFCKVYSFDMSVRYQDDVISFGKMLASRIEEAGEEPSLLKCLPQKGLMPRTARFFSRKLALDNIRYISEENILNLSGKTKGAVADYQLNGNRFQVLIVEYPSPEEADSAFEAYSNHLERKGESVPMGGATQKMVKVGDRYAAVEIDGRIILGFWDFQAPTAPDFGILER